MKKKFFYFAFISVFLISMTSAPSAIAGEDEGFKVFGYVQSWFVTDDSTVPSTSIENEFVVRRARLGVKGHSKIGILPIKYKLLFDAAASSPDLLDAYLDLNIHPLFNVGMGQFKYHFTEIGTASSKIKAIGLLYRPEVSQNIHNPLVGAGTRLRDIGFRIHGKESVNDVKFGYDVEILNGSRGANRADNNDDKTVVAHLFASTMDVTIFGAYFTGESGTEGSTLDENGWTVGAKYRAGPIWIQGEYASANRNQAAGAADIDPNGWYIQGAYQITPELQGVVRYGQADVDDNASNDTMDTVGLGVNYKVNKHATLSANYFIKDADSGYSERTLLGRGGFSTVTGSAVGDVFLFQAEYTY